MDFQTALKGGELLLTGLSVFKTAKGIYKYKLAEDVIITIKR